MQSPRQIVLEIAMASLVFSAAAAGQPAGQRVVRKAPTLADWEAVANCRILRAFGKPVVEAVGLLEGPLLPRRALRLQRQVAGLRLQLRPRPAQHKLRGARADGEAGAEAAHR